MRGLLGLFFPLLLLSACCDPTPEELASLAAKGYYEHLIKGEYEQFLEGKADVRSLPTAYRTQLLDAYKQFVAQQESAHHGIHDVRIVNAKTDTLQNNINVFLVLCFGDSTNEQVVVPMVCRDGAWCMK
jgi:hypothetical protein